MGVIGSIEAERATRGGAERPGGVAPPRGERPGAVRPVAAGWPQWFSGLHAAGFAHRESGAEDLVRRLRRAHAFIDDHSDRYMDLDVMAERAHLSRYHFHRLFRERYGVTPHEWLTQARVRRAQALLAQTDLSVTQVCFEVGYQSLGSFSSLFRRYVGHPPSRYRRRIVQCLWEKPRAVPWCFVAAHGASGPGRAR